MRDLIISLVAVISAFLIVGNIVKSSITSDEYLEKQVTLLPEHPFYLLDEVNEDVLYHTLKHYNFPSPAVITAQAILESGNFKSRLCIDKNNIFGLYNSESNSYFEFDSWISCVFAYKKFILNKYKEKENYYNFLNRIGYSEDSLYEGKVKKLELEILRKYEPKN